MTPRARQSVFLAVCALAVALPVVYVTLARSTPPAYSSTGTAYTVLDRLDPGEKGVLFRSTVPDDSFGKVAFVPLDRVDGPWAVTNTVCDRVYFQGGHGVCEAV